MAKAFKKLSVKCGEYQNQNGDTKGRWRNVGPLMQGDDGGYFIFSTRRLTRRVYQPVTGTAIRC